MLISLDIETGCGAGPDNVRTSCGDKHCKHALDPYRSRITIIGIYYKENDHAISKTFRTVEELNTFIKSKPNVELIGHNFKFDLHHLLVHGLDLRPYWKWDTQLMAHTLRDKLPEHYLADYEKARTEENKKLPQGYSHRKAGHYSLKTLAPYYLNVQRFWEDPTNHDNEKYVIQDCTYTYGLFELFSRKLYKEKCISFYTECLMPWARMLLDAEVRGVEIDLTALSREQRHAKEEMIKSYHTLRGLWRSAFELYESQQYNTLKLLYEEKKEKAIQKLKNKEKAPTTSKRYDQLFKKACEKLEAFNLDSPAQLQWLLKDYLGLDTTNFKGDESTGKEVLEKLATGRRDIKCFLEYRKWRKLITAFFPSYLDKQVEGTIHCTFNPTGTRTGRLSSSEPNLQQVPADLHKLFVARDGYQLATYDMSAIEPVLIAFYSEDPTLFQLLESGTNFHSYNTKVFFDLECDVEQVKELYPRERKLAKEVGLALFYGAGARRIQQSAQKHGFKWNLGECLERYQKFKAAYERVFEYKKELDTVLEKNNITNLLGRSIYFPDKQDIYMKGFNTLIQSSASDLVLESARSIMNRFRKEDIDGHILLLVHDEIVTEVPISKAEQAVEIIKEEMTKFPLTNKWGQVKLRVEGNIAKVWRK